MTHGLDAAIHARHTAKMYFETGCVPYIMRSSRAYTE